MPENWRIQNVKLRAASYSATLWLDKAGRERTWPWRRRGCVANPTQLTDCISRITFAADFHSCFWHFALVRSSVLCPLPHTWYGGGGLCPWRVLTFPKYVRSQQSQTLVGGCCWKRNELEILFYWLIEKRRNRLLRTHSLSLVGRFWLNLVCFWSQTCSTF